MSDEPIEASIWEPGFRKIREKLEATIAEQAAEINVLTNSEHYRIVELESQLARLRRVERAARASVRELRNSMNWVGPVSEKIAELIAAVAALEADDD